MEGQSRDEPESPESSDTEAGTQLLLARRSGRPNRPAHHSRKCIGCSSGENVYKPKSKYCGDVGPFSLLRLRHVVTIGPPAFGPGCCSLASTITHEAVHLRTNGDSRAYDVEKKCFGCSVP